MHLIWKMTNFENTYDSCVRRTKDTRGKESGRQGGERERQAPDAVTQFLARGCDARLPHRAVTRRILAPSVIYTGRFGRGRDVQENPPYRDTTTSVATSIACREVHTSPCRFKAIQEKHVTSPAGRGESTSRRIPSAYSTRPQTRADIAARIWQARLNCKCRDWKLITCPPVATLGPQKPSKFRN